MAIFNTHYIKLPKGTLVHICVFLSRWIHVISWWCCGRCLLMANCQPSQENMLDTFPVGTPGNRVGCGTASLPFHRCHGFGPLADWGNAKCGSLCISQCIYIYIYHIHKYIYIYSYIYIYLGLVLESKLIFAHLCYGDIPQRKLAYKWENHDFPMTIVYKWLLLHICVSLNMV